MIIRLIELLVKKELSNRDYREKANSETVDELGP